MAYSPSVSDINEVSYSPSMADLPENDQQMAISSQASMPLWQRGGADILSGLAQMGHGLLNAPHNIANSISPQLGQQVAPLQPGNPDFSSMLGVNNPNLIDKGIQGVAQYAPYGLLGRAAAVGRGLSSLPSVLPSVLGGSVGGAAFGATQSTTPGRSAAIGAPLGALAEGGIPSLKALSGKILSAFDPDTAASQLMTKLGGGLSIDENQQSLASDIYNKVSGQGGLLAQAGNKYKAVFNAAGDSPIYQQRSLLAGNPNPGKYQQLGDNVSQNYSPEVLDAHNAFQNNPSLENAHNLQSQLGAQIRGLNVNKADIPTANIIGQLSGARSAIKSDMSSFLNKNDLNDQYQDAGNFYLNRVVPYFSSKPLSDISRGIETNPGNIATIFKNPGDNENQIISDLGNQGVNKILYNTLARHSSSPSTILKSYNEGLDNTGLGSLKTPQTEDQFSGLAQTLSNRNLVNKSTFGLTKPFTPQNVKIAKSYIPSPLHNSISNFLNYGYRPEAQSIIANNVGGQ